MIILPHMRKHGRSRGLWQTKRAQVSGFIFDSEFVRIFFENIFGKLEHSEFYSFFFRKIFLAGELRIKNRARKFRPFGSQETAETDPIRKVDSF